MLLGFTSIGALSFALVFSCFKARLSKTKSAKKQLFSNKLALAFILAGASFGALVCPDMAPSLAGFGYAFSLLGFFTSLALLSLFDSIYKAVPPLPLYICFILALLAGTFQALSQNLELPKALLETILNSFFVFASFYLLCLFLKLAFKKPVAGSADAIIIAGLGGWAGVMGAAFSIYAASIAALLFWLFKFKLTRQNKKLAFVPFLSIGAAAELILRQV